MRHRGSRLVRFLHLPGNIYLTGWAGINFPTQDPFQPTGGGGQDAFIAIIGSKLDFFIADEPDPLTSGLLPRPQEKSRD